MNLSCSDCSVDDSVLPHDSLAVVFGSECITYRWESGFFYLWACIVLFISCSVESQSSAVGSLSCSVE